MTTPQRSTLILTPEQHADLYDRIERPYGFLEVVRIRTTDPDVDTALMDAAEALDVLTAAAERMTELVKSAEPFAMPSGEDSEILRGLGIRW